jgi:rhodanese-related sulfurtransferase
VNKVLNIFLGLFLVVTALACAQQNQSSSITMKEFKERLVNDKNLVILDVRTPEELTGPLGKIDNVINIPIQNLAQRIDELKVYKENEILVICRTQNRSAVAVNILQSNGYKAKNVLGGMTDFRK